MKYTLLLVYISEQHIEVLVHDHLLCRQAHLQILLIIEQFHNSQKQLLYGSIDTIEMMIVLMIVCIHWYVGYASIITQLLHCF